MQTAVFFPAVVQMVNPNSSWSLLQGKESANDVAVCQKGPDPKTARQAGRRNKNPPKLKKNVHEVYTGIELGGHTGLQTPGTKLTA